MYRKLFFIIALLACTGITAQTQTMTDYAATRARYVGETLPPEKVYLHFDNTAYYLGETMWFKAFVTSHSEDSPTIFSRVLYVELMSPEGYVVKTDKYRIGDDGTCHGAIYMDPLYLSGYYEIRAYTRYMLNWGDEAIFSRVFPVFDKVNKDNWDFKNIRARDKGTFANKTLKKEKEPELKFYPESGHLVAGIESRVAYELTGVEGVDAYEEVTILANGKPLLVTKPEHMGKGVFTITPVADTEYTAKTSIANREGKVKSMKFKLPEIEKAGIVLSAREETDSFSFAIKRNTLEENDYAFVVLHRSYMSNHRRLGENDSTITIAKAELKEGVNRAIIFCGRTPVAERLFFVQHDSLVQGDRETVKLKVTANGYMLHNVNAKPHKKISITVEREDGKPIDNNTDFALSVTDQAGRQTTSWGYNMYTYMLLGSEIKGYIPDAQQYFDTGNTKRKEHLELVMLTNGWTAYSWKNLTAGSLSGLVPPEEGITVRGNFALRVKKRKFGELGEYRITPQPNNLVRMDHTVGNRIVAETFRTDSLGRFCMILDDFTGKQTIALSPNTIFKHSKRINYAFFIDKYFSPRPQPISYWQKRIGSSIREEKDTAKGMIKVGINEYMLETVNVTAEYNKEMTMTAPISELRLDYLEEWEYAMDVTFREGIKKLYNPYSGEENFESESESESEGESKKENESYRAPVRVTYNSGGGNAIGLNKSHSNNNEEEKDDYSGVLSVSDVMSSIYKRYDIGWQNWVYPVVIEGEYNRDSIPVTDSNYLHGIDVEAMTNFKTVILSSDKKKLETVQGSWGVWERRGEVLKNKHPHQKFYFGFLTQLSIKYPISKDSRIFDEDATEELYRQDSRITKMDLRVDMEHPNQIAYLIPENRDNRSFIGNDLSVKSSTRRYTAVQGYSPEKQFYCPDYSTMVPDSNDFRRTLLWSPNVKPIDGKLQVELYNSSVCNTIAVEALGFNGNTIYSNSAGITTRENDNIGPTTRSRKATPEVERIDPKLLAKCDKEFEKAEIYYNKKNYKKALNSYIELVQHQYPAAYYRIGEFYLKGINLKKRDDLAAKFFGLGAELGMPECYYELSKMYRVGIHYQADRQMELEMLEIAAEMSEPNATLQLCHYLLTGEITEKDTARASELLYREALNGNTDATFQYALIMSSTGIEKDSILGTPLECIRSAALSQSQDAMLWLMDYEYNNGNYREAYMMAKELYILGSDKATVFLAGCYRHGHGVDRDKRLAKDLYREAAKKGNEEAKRILKEW